MKFQSFRFFTERAKAKQLWRFIVRTSYQLPLQQRIEVLEWARHEFRQHSGVTDPDKIKYLVGDGLKRARELGRMLGL